MRVVNTIFCSRGNNAPCIWLAESVNYDITYNLFYSPNEANIFIKGSTTYTSSDVDKIGTGNIYGDPQFILTAWGSEGNYHLKSTSPAIDRGSSSGNVPSIDLEGKSRP